MVYIFQSVNMVYHTEFGEVARYKNNAVAKSLAFLYTNDEKSERQIKETLSFTTATKREIERESMLVMNMLIKPNA